MDDVIFAHNWPHESMSIPSQRVTSLRRRAQANAPAVSRWLYVVSYTTTGAETRRVHLASGVGRGRSLPCLFALTVISGSIQ